MYRKDALGDFPSWYASDQSADWSLLILAAQYGKIGYINDVMGVYRQHSGGFWTGLSRAEQLNRVTQFYEVLRGHLGARFTDRIETALALHRHDLAFENDRMGNGTAVPCSPKESKWLLRVAGDNEARLVAPPGYPDIVRIAIEGPKQKGALIFN